MGSITCGQRRRCSRDVCQSGFCSSGAAAGTASPVSGGAAAAVSGGSSGVARSLAAFICQGSLAGLSDLEYTSSFTSNERDVQDRLHPTPAELDPALAERIEPLIRGSLEDLGQYASQSTIGSSELRMGKIGALGLAGDCFLSQGRTMEAIAKWQTILDEYPTAPDFEYYENKIRYVLTGK